MSSSHASDRPKGNRTLPRGAYGFRILGIGRSALLPPAPSTGWPTLRIAQEPLVGGPPAEATIGEDAAEIPLIDGGVLRLDRKLGTATYATPRPLSDDDLAHPYLAAAASVFAGWTGREAFHAGAFVAGGRAFAVLAGKEGGKSTTLAWLAGRGWPVLTDDVLVVDGSTALAGPRCIDLRRHAADALDPDGRLEGSRAGERRRVVLPEIAPAFPLGGWVVLEWGERVEVERVPPAERIPLVAGQQARAQGGGLAVLELASRPGFVLRRPRSLDALAVVEEHLAALGGVGGEPGRLERERAPRVREV